MNLESKRPPRPLFRVGRDDDAWAVPDWAYAKEDRTFGNRFDDPAGVYRVFYASSQRLGCFIETLARFRTSLSSQTWHSWRTAKMTLRPSARSAEHGLKAAALAAQMSKANMRTSMPSHGSAISVWPWPRLR